MDPALRETGVLFISMRPMCRLSGSLDPEASGKEKVKLCCLPKAAEPGGLLFSHLLMVADVESECMFLTDVHDFLDSAVGSRPFPCSFKLDLLHPVGLKLSAVHLPFHSRGFMKLNMLIS